MYPLSGRCMGRVDKKHEKVSTLYSGKKEQSAIEISRRWVKGLICEECGQKSRGFVHSPVDGWGE